MPREVTDGEGVRWTCVQAYAGLAQSADEAGNQEAASVGGGRFRVVCTPSGGAQTVALELPGGWEEELGDDALLREIEANRGA